MGIAQQDLVFKLSSIGVRLEGEDETIDTEIIAAILAGKKLTHQPREVILRDAESTAKAPPVVRRPPPRRTPANPLRRPPRRTIIQKVEPRIRAIPVRERARRGDRHRRLHAVRRARLESAVPAVDLPLEESAADGRAGRGRGRGGQRARPAARGAAPGPRPTPPAPARPASG